MSDKQHEMEETPGIPESEDSIEEGGEQQVVEALGTTALEQSLQPSREAKSERVGTLIKELRKAFNISGEELGNRLGVSRSTVNHWETGRRKAPSSIQFARDLFTAVPEWGEAEREQLVAAMGLKELISNEYPSSIDFKYDLIRRLERIQKLAEKISELQRLLIQELALLHEGERREVLNLSIESETPQDKDD